MGGPIYIIGQIFGFVAIVLGILSYQMKTQKNLILLQFATSVVFCAHYLMIGAISGMALNIVCALRNLTFWVRSIKGSNDKITPIIFTVITAVVGVISWEAWYSVFIFFGLVINAFCMSFANPQNIRKSILVTSPLVMIYDVFSRSYGGFLYESVAIASSVVGMLRYRKNGGEPEAAKQE